MLVAVSDMRTCMIIRDRVVGVLLVHAGHRAQQAMEEVRILLLLALVCMLQLVCPNVR